MYGYIYIIENTINGKLYIGQTTQPPSKREYNHFSELKHNKHNNPHLQYAFNKYDEDDFKFKVISWFNSKEELNERSMTIKLKGTPHKPQIDKIKIKILINRES